MFELYVALIKTANNRGDVSFGTSRFPLLSPDLGLTSSPSSLLTAFSTIQTSYCAPANFMLQ